MRARHTVAYSSIIAEARRLEAEAEPGDRLHWTFDVQIGPASQPTWRRWLKVTRQSGCDVKVGWRGGLLWHTYRVHVAGTPRAVRLRIEVLNVVLAMEGSS